MGETSGSVQVSRAVRGVTSLASKSWGAFSPGDVGRDEPISAALTLPRPLPHTTLALPVVKVMLAGEVKFGPRRPRTVAV